MVIVQLHHPTTINPRRSHQTIILLGMGESATRVVAIMEEIATVMEETTVTATKVVAIMEEIATVMEEKKVNSI
jgi:hypothetical protein